MIEKINFVLLVLFFLCYSYQIVYVPVSLFAKRKKCEEVFPQKKIAVLSCGKNEEAVIGYLIKSIKESDYPQDMVDVFVCADNCTDNTAGVALDAGAIVFSRNSSEGIGKGYALKFLLEEMGKNGYDNYDAYLIMDADNVVCSDYLQKMSDEMSKGYNIITSYRNSKNFGDNWVSAGYALWFLREARYLSGARKALNISCAVSGTGFMFSKAILDKMGGTWKYFLLTEDIEFSIVNICDGEKIGYAEEAVFFDEQPTSFRQSFRQRLRWARGYYQVFKYHGKDLLKGLFHGNFSCYDMAMNLCPAAILSLATIVVNIIGFIMNLAYHTNLSSLTWSILDLCGKAVGLVAFMGMMTTITEWKQIHTTPFKKVLYCITFPIFILTYIPVAIAAFFVRPSWKPIVHTKSIDVNDVVSK